MSLALDLRVPTTEDSGEPGFWVDGNTVTIRSETRLDTYRLPRRRPRVAVTEGGQRAQLIIGTFTGTLVAIHGPRDVIYQLRDAVL